MESAKGKKIIRMMAARLFVALMIFSVVGWVVLFGNYLPSWFSAVIYALIGATIAISVFVLWKRSHVLRDKRVMAGLMVFVIIGAIGWLSALPEITGCRPYKCGDDFSCSRPTEIGVKITTGECTSEFSENSGIICTEESGTCTERPVTS